MADRTNEEARERRRSRRVKKKEKLFLPSLKLMKKKQTTYKSEQKGILGLDSGYDGLLLRSGCAASESFDRKMPW